MSAAAGKAAGPADAACTEPTIAAMYRLLDLPSPGGGFTVTFDEAVPQGVDLCGELGLSEQRWVLKFAEEADLELDADGVDADMPCMVLPADAFLRFVTRNHWDILNPYVFAASYAYRCESLVLREGALHCTMDGQTARISMAYLRALAAADRHAGVQTDPSNELACTDGYRTCMDNAADDRDGRSSCETALSDCLGFAPTPQAHRSCATVPTRQP